MAGSKEIRNKIKSVQSTRKITKAMEMVAASKMKKAQERMRQTRPYLVRMLQIVMHVAKANTEYKHPFLAKRETVKRIGAIVVTTDKGLCGGLNTNVLRTVMCRASCNWAIARSSTRWSARSRCCSTSTSKAASTNCTSSTRTSSTR
jgi:ATP synthase F1 gamma subunit